DAGADAGAEGDDAEGDAEERGGAEAKSTAPAAAVTVPVAALPDEAALGPGVEGSTRAKNGKSKSKKGKGGGTAVATGGAAAAEAPGGSSQSASLSASKALGPAARSDSPAVPAETEDPGDALGDGLDEDVLKRLGFAFVIRELNDDFLPGAVVARSALPEGQDSSLKSRRLTRRPLVVMLPPVNGGVAALAENRVGAIIVQNAESVAAAIKASRPDAAEAVVVAASTPAKPKKKKSVAKATAAAAAVAEKGGGGTRGPDSDDEPGNTAEAAAAAAKKGWAWPSMGLGGWRGGPAADADTDALTSTPLDEKETKALAEAEATTTKKAREEEEAAAKAMAVAARPPLPPQVQEKINQIATAGYEALFTEVLGMAREMGQHAAAAKDNPAIRDMRWKALKDKAKTQHTQVRAEMEKKRVEAEEQIAKIRQNIKAPPAADPEYVARQARERLAGVWTADVAPRALLLWAYRRRDPLGFAGGPTDTPPLDEAPACVVVTPLPVTATDGGGAAAGA
ncbi:unnamed protein product, partial [Phaeothamnion confervicola]